MKPVKKLLGEDGVEAVLQRLDRLTPDEARTTAVQTLGVVYGLIQNMRIVIDGKKTYLTCFLPAVELFPLDGKASIDNIRDVLGKFVGDVYKPNRCLTES